MKFACVLNIFLIRKSSHLIQGKSLHSKSLLLNFFMFLSSYHFMWHFYCYANNSNFILFCSTYSFQKNKKSFFKASWYENIECEFDAIYYCFGSSMSILCQVQHLKNIRKLFLLNKISPFLFDIFLLSQEISPLKF